MTSGLEMMKMYSQAAFVLSPKGTHFDCWRHYEAIVMGSIPIVDDHFTLHETLHNMPAVFVQDWRVLSRDRLLTHLEEIVSRDHNFEPLTRQFWLDHLTEDEDQ